MQLTAAYPQKKSMNTCKKLTDNGSIKIEGVSNMSLPPFINSTGLISKIFHKIQEAKVPERYTTDFQSTVLGYGSGSARAFIPFLKRLGFLETDGKPTDFYKRFRNSDSSGAAMAEAMRLGFGEIFRRNEYAYELPPEKLKNLIIEISGKEKGDTSVKAVTASFLACNSLADFNQQTNNPPNEEEVRMSESTPTNDRGQALVEYQRRGEGSKRGIGLSYTINLNLPETNDIDVFNAIFKSLRENILDAFDD